LGSSGVGYEGMGSPLDLGGLVDRSLRHLGQLLVVMAALLGAALGIALALIVEHAATSGTMVTPGRERSATLAASPSSSRPPASREASSEGSAAGDGASATRRAEAADQGDGKAEKSRDRPGKPGKGKDKPDKGKGGSR
jgi:hypothetical protein